ncbi:hypothetical protein ABBQ32_008859 [Trebouxia sp. C0010 RCD-2024]
MTSSNAEGRKANDTQVPAHKCCLGMLYYSQSIHDKGKNPVCGGVRSKHLTSPDLAEVPPESIPNGEFKYMCLGYSMHVDRQQKRQRSSTDQGADMIELPYCEGIQVVMATDTQQSPMLQAEASQEAAPTQQATDRRPPRRTYSGGQADNNLGGVNLGDLSDRFIKTSGKIVEKMGSNLGQIAATAKQAAKKVGEQIWGKGRDQ